MSLPALDVIDVTKRYANGVVALQHVSLAVAQGETLVLIGESGSGKTTLLRLFNRMEQPTTGVVRIQGQSVEDMDPITLRRHIGYVQQDGGLLPHWTVQHNIGLVPTLLRWPADHIFQRTSTLLELVNLSPSIYAGRYPAELSGGERQRVAFARALAADPDIVLLDEPFGALDAITRNELQEQFLKIKHTLQKTMVFVTHDLHEAFRLGDRIAILHAGQVRQVDTPQALLEHPADAYVRTLLAYYRREV
ncbi:MAG: ATP-binding cassette domain-containing protein [Nitrospirae bacterium]|nr:MAG: ATP-binding cassette domain-containing protein [Nitrospirota bacterium]